jgi:hypothetical protein
MISEAKILFENIKHFRQLLTEGVNDKVIVDAINQHKFLYIYYKGETTIETGYRTIRPFVLGVNTGGNLAVRAWQDKGRSDSLRADSPRNRLHHEHEVDTDGVIKPGWRLFLVDHITSAIPTGKRFIDAQGNVEIPTGYKENDKDMTGGIIASVTAGEKTPVSGIPATKQKMPRWDKYKDANKNNRQITKADVLGLNDIAKKVMKKPISDFFVAIDNKNNYNLQDIRTKGKFPQNAYVDDLVNLNKNLVTNVAPSTAQTQEFPKKQKADMINSLVKKENENNPIDKKTFFKQ